MTLSDKPSKERGSKKTARKSPNLMASGFVYIGLLLIVFFLLDRFVVAEVVRPELSYSKLSSLVQDGKVAKVSVNEYEITGELKESMKIEISPGNTRDVQQFRALPIKNTEESLLKLLNAHKVEVRGTPDTTALTQFLLWGSLIGLMLVGWWVLLRKFNPQRSVGLFGRSRARIVAEDEIDVSFDDVAGIDGAKEELEELLLFMREPERFRKLGARIPRGVLLVGSPGTGKTLLAKAVAGEAKVPFFSLSGSDFVEMFAGVGASRVRDLFSEAQKQAPCIVFIDELDAIGKIRGVGHSGAHDEREQTLNQLLAQMDGFDSNIGIIVLSATNRPEILDPALLRPGRFDRQVVVDRPDISEREAILKVHAKKVILNDDVSLPSLARETPGFVGADLANLVNEAALLAARRSRESVTSQDFSDAIQRVVAGLEKRSRVMRPQEKRRIAFHETGHALVALMRSKTDPVHRVSIISRGTAALGYTMQMPSEDRYIMTKEELEQRLEVMLGGRVAERVAFGDCSTGAADDLRRAVALARKMVKEYGMSERFGPVAFEDRRRAVFLGGDEASGTQSYSDATAQEIDDEIRKIVSDAEGRVSELLTSQSEVLTSIAEELIERETLEERELLEVAIAAGASPDAAKLARLHDEAEASSEIAAEPVAEDANADNIG